MFPLRDSVRSRRFPIVNYAIIILNLIVFANELRLFQSGSVESFFMAYGLIPAKFFHDPAAQWTTLFSSMFLHGGWGHVLGNMWFLFIFGDNVEDNLGHIRYAIYYLLMGLGAAAAQLYFSQTSRMPMVGASGAIAGILGSYFILYPSARILTAVWFFYFLRLIEIPSFFFLGIWFLMQTVNGIGSLGMSTVRGDMGGIAWWAHAGGFATGFSLILFFRRRR